MKPIDPGVRVGHVHLKVANLNRALNFYCGVLGLELMQRIGDTAAFISAWRVSPPHRAEYLGEPEWTASGDGDDGAVSPGAGVSGHERHLGMRSTG